MANQWGALQSTITKAYKTANKYVKATWLEITATVMNEGETTERRALDTVKYFYDPVTESWVSQTGEVLAGGINAVHVMQVDPVTGNPVEPLAKIKINEPIPLESFDETDLSSGSYTVVTTDTVTGFGIHNNSTATVVYSSNAK